MKTKLIGLAILAAVAVGAVVYALISGGSEVTEINGYVAVKKSVCWRTRRSLISFATTTDWL